MRIVFGLVLVAGIGLAGFAVYMAKGHFSTSSAEIQRLQKIANGMVETVDVIVMKNKVVYGQKLTKNDIKLVKWPVTSLPKGVFQYPAAKTKDGKPGIDLFPKDSDKLRSVLRTMEVNEPVMALKVTEPGRDAGITSRLTTGMRAFAIKVDVSSGVSGFLRPGDRVDVYWTGVPPNSNSGGKITKLIETTVHLIAIDQSANDDISGANVARTVTVEASPQQVAALAQAQGSGRLSLSLVGTGDISETGAIQMSQRDLLGIEATKVVEIQEERECTIKTRKGGEVVEIAIPCTN